MLNSKTIDIMLTLLNLFIVIYYFIKLSNAKIIGITGPIGMDGTRGLIGKQGNIGLSGKNIDRIYNQNNIMITEIIGPPGQQGIDGLPGPLGPDGPIGMDGLPGLPGGIGNTGLTGLTGPKGMPGIDGKNITKNIFLLTKYNDCTWTYDKECPDNNVISGIDNSGILRYYCCPTRLYIV